MTETIPEDPLHVSYAGRALRSIPTLTAPLHTLTLTSNELHDLPPLPSSLLRLDISRNWFRKVPTLPSSLSSLDASHNLLRNSGLSALPLGLEKLDLRFNQNLNKATYLTALSSRLPSTSVLMTVTSPPPPDLYVGSSPALRDAGLLRSQLEPWPTSVLRRRVVSDFHGPFLGLDKGRGEVMEALLGCYGREGVGIAGGRGCRVVLNSRGKPLEEEMLSRARGALERWSNGFENGNEERVSVKAEHYMILTR